ncbi:MAG: ABC transporter permease [Planctomycetes bacterium]|nr:ABC transporter permease [Planctomycetota bacterium]
MDLLRIAPRHLLRHPLRTLLTLGSLTVAIFMLCVLRSLVTTLEASAQSQSSQRLWVQSAVSLFVEMPSWYPERIAGVEGVESVARWQWFGGYYQDPSNFFAQFAVDPEKVLDLYPELDLVEGTSEAFLSGRTTCLVGKGLADQFGWRVGDTVPLMGALFPHPDGADKAWDFQVAAIYEPRTRNLDDRTLFFHWKLFEETLSATGEAPGVGAMVLRAEPGQDTAALMRRVDTLFENGPQRTQTTTESEFQAQFVSMYGNVPFFVSAIGGGVLAAVLLACVNTMLMAAREQRREAGILKALGFTDATVGRLLLAQSLFVTVVGGGLGILLARAVEPGVAQATGAFLPGFAIERETYLLALGISVGAGLVAGLLPAWRARRMRVIDALGARV